MIDVSQYNGAIEWDKVTASFVYLKATEGDNYVDPTYKERVVECRERSILVGAYHYLTTSSDPKDQFDNFKRTVKKKDISLRPVLDIEENRANLSKVNLRKYIRMFAELCKREYGTYPIIYSSQKFYLKYLVGMSFDFWCGAINKRVHVPHIIHQISIREVSGVKGKVDYNILKCDLDKIKL